MLLKPRVQQRECPRWLESQRAQAIDSDGALPRSTARGKSKLTSRAVNGVNVRRHFSRIHNRVDSGEADPARAFHAPEGVGAANEGGGDGDEVLHRDRNVSKLEMGTRGEKEWTTRQGCLKGECVSGDVLLVVSE